MRYAEFRPAPDLSSHVDRYWLLSGCGSGGPILPDGHPELVVHLGDPPLHDGIRQGRVLLVGQVRTATTLAIDGTLLAWGIRFHPHTAPEVTGGIAEWADADGLRERVGTALDDAGRVAATDAWLRTPRRLRPRSALAAEAVRLLPQLPVDAVADRTGYSRRHLERVFRAEVGIGPKAWARIVRLQVALRLREIRPEWTWAAVAAEAGYSDQAHLALDFRAIAGSAPGQFGLSLMSHSF